MLHWQAEHCSSQVGSVRPTWIPDTVKYGISNLMWIGGRPSESSATTLGRPKWARMRKSLPPGNDLMVQTTELVSGEYRQLPAVVLNLGESASTGTGTMISTLFAVERRLNWLLAYIHRQHDISSIGNLPPQTWQPSLYVDKVKIKHTTAIITLINLHFNSPPPGFLLEEKIFGVKWLGCFRGHKSTFVSQ